MAKGHDMVDSTAIGPTGAIGRLSSGTSSKPVSHTISSGEIAQARSLPKLIRLANELAEQELPIDYAKIAILRQAVALGTYKPDPVAIADAITRFGRPG